MDNIRILWCFLPLVISKFFLRDCQPSENSLNHFKNKGKYLSTTTLPFFFRNRIILTEKIAFGKIFLNFGIKFCIYPSIKANKPHKTYLNNNSITKGTYSYPKWKKYTKTSENLNSNEFLLETLAWINFSRREWIILKQRIVSFPKYAVFKRIVVYVSYYSEVLFEYTKKSGRGSEKSEVWNERSRIVPLTCSSYTRASRSLITRTNRLLHTPKEQSTSVYLTDK